MLINDRPTSVDLVELVMLDFDVIMGMDWLATCYANIDCRAKLVRFHFPGELVLEYHLEGEVTIGPELPVEEHASSEYILIEHAHRDDIVVEPISLGVRTGATLLLGFVK